jgi:hypothetical protein
MDESSAPVLDHLIIEDGDKRENRVLIGAEAINKVGLALGGECAFLNKPDARNVRWLFVTHCHPATIAQLRFITDRVPPLACMRASTSRVGWFPARLASKSITGTRCPSVPLLKMRKSTQQSDYFYTAQWKFSDSMPDLRNEFVHLKTQFGRAR